jgi:hypothetical protein
VISSDHLEPGSVGRVQATVNTGSNNGYISKHISIYSNDRTQPVLSVEVTMDVVNR